MDTNFLYDDIVNLPHPTSKKHPRMSIGGAGRPQFSPFAALTGFGAVIQETGRPHRQPAGALRTATSARLEEQLTWLAEHEGEHPEVTVTYFLPDERQGGGRVRHPHRPLKAPGPGGAGAAAGSGGRGCPLGTSFCWKRKNKVCREEPLAITPPAWYSYLR